MTQKGFVLGIDLGTSNTAAVAFGPEGSSEPVSILHGRDQTVMPSIVSLKNPRLPIVGWLAKDMLLTDPLTTIYGWKRFLGRSADSEFVVRHRTHFPFRIQATPNGSLGAVVQNHVITFVEIATMVLDQVRLQAKAALARDVRDVVISVPAHFNRAQRGAVLLAATRAGLQVMNLINEPTAAALAFGLDQGLYSRVLVFDLGGGTFDSSILELTENVFDVRGTRGESFLGGLDFDRAIMHRLIAYCKTTHRLDPSEEPVVAQRLLNASEHAKKLLSSHESVDVRVPMVGVNHRGQQVDLEYRLSRAELEHLTAPLVERALGLVEELLKDLDCTPRNIDHVILSGGQSRMPLFQRRIEQVLGKKPLSNLDPDLCVALGAAISAQSRERLDSAVLLDVLSMPIGVLFPGGRSDLVFESNTSLPAKATIPLTKPPTDSGLAIGLFQATDLASADRHALGMLRMPRKLFTEGESFWLDLTLSEDLNLRATFRTSTTKQPILLEQC